MKNIRWSLLLIVVFALFLSACGNAAETTLEVTEAPEMEETEQSEPVPDPTELPATEEPKVTEEPLVTEEPMVTDEPESGSTQSVRVVDSAFEDREITVTVGTTVMWTHSGNFPHTVTADDSSFDSGNLASGNVFSVTYNEVGTFPYYCSYHGGPNGSGMAGVVIVTE